jgi:hypothetical protein
MVIAEPTELEVEETCAEERRGAQKVCKCAVQNIGNKEKEEEGIRKEDET